MPRCNKPAHMIQHEKDMAYAERCLAGLDRALKRQDVKAYRAYQSELRKLQDKSMLLDLLIHQAVADIEDQYDDTHLVIDYAS